MGRKIATIGITINLENYENLRLEVQGEIGADGDTEELVAFLDGMLARLGHGDEATGELVDAYRRRVLAMPGTGVAPGGTARPAPARKGEEAAPAPVTQPASPPQLRPAATAPIRETAVKPVEPRPQAEAPREERPPTTRVSVDAKAVKPTARPQARPETAAPHAQTQEPVPRRTQTPQATQETPKEQAPKAEKPKITEGEVACEGCGASITKNQEKLSRLLTGKSLCKRCMNP